MGKKLINASNLHVGGGVQVATSLVSELALLTDLPKDLVVWASSEVDASLKGLRCDLSTLPHYEVVNSRGLRQLLPSFGYRLRKFDAVFTVFGPLYCWFSPSVSIVGFAQAWIINPDNEVYEKLTPWDRLLTRLKFRIQKAFFSRADAFVVELEHVKEGLIRAGIGESRDIYVVHNCLSALYSTPAKWQAIDIADSPSRFRIGFVGRNYSHKNTSIFPEIQDILRRDYGLEVGFYVTFTDEEWESCDREFKAKVVNVGPLSLKQCPSFYRAMDAIIFPSLLECFSATPLEAMAMEKPLFASDRPFNHDVCGSHAHYFDPMDPAHAAALIAAYILDPTPKDQELAAARTHSLSFSSGARRARAYLDCLYSRLDNNTAV